MQGEINRAKTVVSGSGKCQLGGQARLGFVAGPRALASTRREGKRATQETQTADAASASERNQPHRQASEATGHVR